MWEACGTSRAEQNLKGKIKCYVSFKEKKTPQKQIVKRNTLNMLWGGFGYKYSSHGMNQSISFVSH